MCLIEDEQLKLFPECFSSIHIFLTSILSTIADPQRMTLSYLCLDNYEAATSRTLIERLNCHLLPYHTHFSVVNYFLLSWRHGLTFLSSYIKDHSEPQKVLHHYPNFLNQKFIAHLSAFKLTFIIFDYHLLIAYILLALIFPCSHFPSFIRHAKQLMSCSVKLHLLNLCFNNNCLRKSML